MSLWAPPLHLTAVWHLAQSPARWDWDTAECWWHEWLTELLSAESHAKEASEVSGIKWLFLIFTLSFKRSYRCSGWQDFAVFLWPHRRDRSLLCFMLRAGFGCHWRQIPIYMCTMHLAKETAALGRAVRHVLMAKERKIPPRYPTKTLFTGVMWSRLRYKPRAARNNTHPPPPPQKRMLVWINGEGNPDPLLENCAGVHPHKKLIHETALNYSCTSHVVVFCTREEASWVVSIARSLYFGLFQRSPTVWMQHVIPLVCSLTAARLCCSWGNQHCTPWTAALKKRSLLGFPTCFSF